jgi:hypothetical protein
MDLTGIGEGLSAIQKIIAQFFPNKSAEEQATLTAAFAALQGQMDIDKAEAQSSDPLQHWRGGLGWVCVFGYAWTFALSPIGEFVFIAIGHPITLPHLDIGQLATLTLGMLGLGGLHVAERLKGAA